MPDLCEKASKISLLNDSLIRLRETVARVDRLKNRINGTVGEDEAITDFSDSLKGSLEDTPDIIGDFCAKMAEDLNAIEDTIF